MIELIEELGTASSLLNTALGKYLDACLAIQNHYTQISPTDVTRLLLDCIAKELPLATSYEINIKQARSIISQARNCSPAIVSIQSLPTEVFIRIFHHVVGARPCHIDVRDHSGANTSLPRYPDFLSHVCSRWRQIIMGMPSLWTHIDIINFHSLSQGSVLRSEACLARASDFPLDIHIRVPSSYDFSHKSTLLNFLASVATRIRSLELTLPEALDDFDYSILEWCFEQCIPGTLTRLMVSDRSGDVTSFIEAAEDEGNVAHDSLWLRLPHQRFEDILQSITVLWLDGVYPLWTSQAYHGLVELRLTCARVPRHCLTKLELYAVLVHNPNLRVLEFGLDITIPPPESLTDNSDPVVYLGELEVLNLSSLDYDQLNVILGLLNLGSKPLHLNMCYDLKVPLSSRTDAVTLFFQRSNITRLQVKGLGPHPKLEDIVSLLPRLRVLVLDGIIDRKRKNLAIREYDIMPTSFRLDALYLLNSHIHIGHVREAIKKHPVQRLIFWRCSISSPFQPSMGHKEIEDMLAEICPEVEQIEVGKTSPILGWD